MEGKEWGRDRGGSR